MSFEEENFNQELNGLLQKEQKYGWQRINIGPKLALFLSYGVPALLMFDGLDYYSQDAAALLFISLLLGTGFYVSIRHYTSLRAFYSNAKPTKQVIQDIKAQDRQETYSFAPTPPVQLSPDEEPDFEMLVENLENTLNGKMNVSTLFDQNQLSNHPATNESWLKRIFRRN